MIDEQAAPTEISVARNVIISDDVLLSFLPKKLFKRLGPKETRLSLRHLVHAVACLVAGDWFKSIYASRVCLIFSDDRNGPIRMSIKCRRALTAVDKLARQCGVQRQQHAYCVSRRQVIVIAFILINAIMFQRTRYPSGQRFIARRS